MLQKDKSIIIIFLSLLEVCLLSEAKEIVIIRYQVDEEVSVGSFIGNLMDDWNFHRKHPKELLQNLNLVLINKNVPFFALKKGKLQVVSRLDREDSKINCMNKLACEISLKVGVQIGRDFEMIQVIIELGDINDHEPVFNQTSAHFSLSEATLVSSSFSLPQAFDPDSPIHGIQRYHLKSKQTSDNNFKLIIDTKMDGTLDPKLMVVEILDRETKDTYHFTLFACETTVAPRCATLHFVVLINDVNDNKPIFKQPSYNVNVSENFETGKTILKVEASDADLGMNSKIEFSLAKTPNRFSYNRYFVLDSVTGNLMLSEKLDREKIEVFEIFVIAKDKGGNSLINEVPITVRVLDVNDNPPSIEVTNIFSGSIYKHLKEFKNYERIKNVVNSNVFSHSANKTHNRNGIELNRAKDNNHSIEEVQAIKVDEHVPLNTFIAHVRAYDVDSEGITKIQCHIDNTDNFALIADSTEQYSAMEYQVITNRLFDVEDMIFSDQSLVFNISITCSDNPPQSGKSLSSEATFYVMIADVNDWVPRVKEKSFHISKFSTHLETNETILKISGVDEDASFENSKYFFSILKEDWSLDANVHEIFQIDAFSGELSIKKSEFEMSSQVSNYFEHNLQKTRRVDGLFKNGVFTESNKSIDINLMIYKYLNFICFPIKITDTGVPQLFSLENIHVTFNNSPKPSNLHSNEEPTDSFIFSSSLYIFKVREGSFDLSKPIGKIFMLEKGKSCFDRNVLLHITFQMINDASAPFLINKTTGYIYSKSILDREEKSNYMFLVEVELKRNSNYQDFKLTEMPNATKVVPVIVMILDQNDNFPFISNVVLYKFVNNSKTIFPVRKSKQQQAHFFSIVFVPPKIYSNFPLLKVIALDYDDGENSRISFNLSRNYFDFSFRNISNINETGLSEIEMKDYGKSLNFFLNSINPFFYINSKTGILYFKFKPKNNLLSNLSLFEKICKRKGLSEKQVNTSTHSFNGHDEDYENSSDFDIFLNNFACEPLYQEMIKYTFKNPIRLEITVKDEGINPKESLLHLCLVLNYTDETNEILRSDFLLRNLTKNERKWIENFDKWPSTDEGVYEWKKYSRSGSKEHSSFLLGFNELNFFILTGVVFFLILSCFTLLIGAFLKLNQKPKSKRHKTQQNCSKEHRELTLFKSSIKNEQLSADPQADNSRFCSLQSAIKKNYSNTYDVKKNSLESDQENKKMCLKQKTSPYFPVLSFQNTFPNTAVVNSIVYGNEYISKHINNFNYSETPSKINQNKEKILIPNYKTLSFLDIKSNLKKSLNGDLENNKNKVLKMCFDQPINQQSFNNDASFMNDPFINLHQKLQHNNLLDTSQRHRISYDIGDSLHKPPHISDELLKNEQVRCLMSL